MSLSKMPKLCFVRIPTLVDATASTAPICPPIGMAYLKAISKKYTNDITVVDAIGNHPHMKKLEFDGRQQMIIGENFEEITAQVPANTDIMLVSIMFSQDWPFAMHLLPMLREKAPHAIIVAGGEHISAVPEYSLKSAPALDICVLGEGEETLEEILRKFTEEKSLENIPGTCFKQKDGTIVRYLPRERIGSIDQIPWPDWTGFPLENYLSGGHGFGVNLGRTMPIVATRGCPYQCTFCSNAQMWTTAWKPRAPEDVLNEIKTYMKLYKATNFDFYDLTAVVKREWILKFANLLITEKLNITWQLPSGTRSEAIDRDVAKALFESGCRNLSYAPESGSYEVLTMIKKRVQLPRMLQSMRDCISQGLSIKANIICGFPDEKPKHLIDTYKFILKMAWVGVDDMSINQFSPYPGSELFESLVNNGIVKMDDEYFKSLSYYSSMSHAHSYSKNLTSKQIIIFKFIGTASFYLLSFIRHPGKFIRMFVNASKGIETTRMEKTLNSYFSRLRAVFR